MKAEYLKDIRHERNKDDRVCDWVFKRIGNYDVRLYYKQNNENGLGFDFYAFERTGYICNKETDKNSWNETFCNGECVVCGVAYYDGIRHLYYGDENTDNYGYHYYAKLEMIIEVLKELRELEKKYCRNYD